MKTSALTAMALAVGLAVSVNGAMAEDKVKTTNGAFTVDRAHMDTKHLEGMTVNTPDGKRAGEIEHLIVKMSDGKITHAIIGFGGIAGVGEKKVVVPWSQVKIRRNESDRKDVAVIDRATLDAAPRYTRVDRDRAPAASPATSPSGDKDKDGVRNKDDRAPSNPAKQ